MSTVLPQYPFDPTGTASTNVVTETQAIQSRGMFDHYYIIPRSGPFYAESVKLRLYPTGANVNNPLGGELLEEGVHYNFGYHFAHASHTIGKAVYAAISFYDRALEGQLRMEYQNVGGDWVLDDQKFTELLANVAYNPRIATWEQVVELPFQFPVVNHDFNIDDFVGMSEVVDQLEDITEAIAESSAGSSASHVLDKNNPHDVTKDQVGLGLVENYPVAAVNEATQGTANNRYMTPLRTKQLIDAIAMAAHTAHLSDYTNPHQVTKTQVGLGNVQNYALSSQAEAEAGASNARYMTPLRVREAIIAIVGTAFANHVTDHTNPHGVTKAQVGLGNVPNIGVASDAEAIAGQGDGGLITPRLLGMVLSETLGEGVADHIAASDNPHGVTKGQVGLGEVQNFGLASEAEARDATAANKYMTPLAVRQAINALVGDSSNAHVSDFDNPHHVTAAQVGTYDRAELDQLLENKLDQTEVAGDSARVYGLNQEGLAAWISSQKAGDSINFDGKSYTEVKADILSGKAADSAMLDGKSYQDIKAEITAVTNASSFQFPLGGVPVVADGTGAMVTAPENWLKIGTMLQPLDYAYADLTLMITGGRDEDEEHGRHHSVLVEIATTNDYPAEDPTVTQMPLIVREAICKYLTPATFPINIGYVINQSETRPSLDIYIKSEGMMTPWTVTELSNKLFTPADIGLIDEVADLVTVEPSGITYATVLLEGTAEIEALQAFTQRTDNPHQVTKAQVGLGSVSNFGTSTPAEAITGTATNKFMTPATTAAKVDDSIGVLCDELIEVIDDALLNLFA